MKSVFLRRLLAALVLAMLLTATVVVAGYSVLSRNVYTNMQMEEMLPKAEAAKQLFYEYRDQNITAEAFERVGEYFMSAAAAESIIINQKGEIIFPKDKAFDMELSVLAKNLESEISAVLSGNAVQEESIKVDGNKRLIAVGVPLNDDNGKIIAGILMLQEYDEIIAGSEKLATALFWITLIVVPVTLAVMAWRMKKVAEPLNKMSEAAIEMSKGNFDIRLNENEKGEIGVLASALNNLCETLSKTVYKLRTEKGQLDQILQSLTDGVAATDATGKLVHCNTALMRMFGAVKAQKREDIVRDQMIWDKFDEVYESGATKTVTLKMPGDKSIWITITPVVTEENERVGVVGLFKDVSDMERLENMRKEYVANVSHELRTPLTSIRGLLEPLTDGMVKDEEDKQRYYKIMLHEVVRLSRLISDMLKLSRLQSGADYTEYSRVDIKELLNDVVGSYTENAAQKGITLLLDADDVGDAMTDSGLVEQVLVILLDNAMKYTEPGGTITLSVKDGERLLVSVADTGVGISEEDQEHIFERFYKVDKSHGDGGTGLGLSIAATIIDRLQEKIKVHSIEGEGTRFTFTLKKYVSSAIRLGPANEEIKIVNHDSIVRSVKDDTSEKIKDAEYFVIKTNENGKKKKNRNKK
ncbi:MAG: HAMP domain-containing protein [Clostridia bacterium]|nr:HAMP domain-containing protein [Clostridia bacterium]